MASGLTQVLEISVIEENEKQVDGWGWIEAPYKGGKSLAGREMRNMEAKSILHLLTFPLKARTSGPLL